MLVNLLGLYYGGMYMEPTDKILPIFSCPICSILLLELGRGNGKDNRHRGSYLHPATVSCLSLHAAQLNKKSNGN